MNEIPMTDELFNKLTDDLTTVLEEDFKVEETPSETKVKKSI